MKVRIALAGELIPDQYVFGKIDLLIGQITGYLCKNIENEELQMLVSPSYTGKEWMNWSKNHDFSLCTYNMRGSTEYLEQCSQTIKKDTPLRNLLGEEMCDKADALIVTWNEDVTELSGATWELLQIAYDRKVPCIWISQKSQQTYCLWDSYYEKYSPKYLEAAGEPLQDIELAPPAVEEEKGRTLSFWENCRSKYLKKYKADKAVHPSEEDVLLTKSFKMEQGASGGEMVRQILLEKFHRFDDAAIELNTRFQAMIYQRSVLPFIATIFLAVGFYVETLLGTTTSVIFPGLKSSATVITLVIAGLGFLVHGALNLYTYRLSKSVQIHQWQQEFTNNRYIAEVLRILIHFLPYGIALNLRKLCGGDQKLYAAVKHLTDDEEPAEQHIDRKRVHCVLQHVNEMVDDQLAYHKASVGRYERIVNSLEKWGKRIMYIGLAVVIARGALQFLLVLLRSVQVIRIEDLIEITPEMEAAESLKSTMISIVRSGLNMLALLLPAWAGYFTTKAQQNNFQYNLNNHQNMVSRLTAIRKKVIRAMEQDEIPLEVVNVMIEELAETMLLQDTSQWHQQYMNSTVKPL